MKLEHVPVLREEILSFLPPNDVGRLLDVTAGGGGHFFDGLRARPAWHGEAWDQDPMAEARLHGKAQGENWIFRRRNFRDAPSGGEKFTFILADIGLSSFQIDDPQRGMSLHSKAPPDFRMNPQSGSDFRTWLSSRTEAELSEIIANFGEEPRATRIAHAIKGWGADAFLTADAFASRIAVALGYTSPSKIHPATRTFQALRIAINDELGALRSLLRWAPETLAVGGRLAVISFHSLEDRLAKNAFRTLAEDEDFVILTKRPIVPSAAEREQNPRSRSAKLRVLERRGKI